MGCRAMGAGGRAPHGGAKPVRRADQKRYRNAHCCLRSRANSPYPTRKTNPPGGEVMGKVCNVQVNGETFSANQGDVLLDAALVSGVDLPNDCRSGYCGSCHVRVVQGRTFGGETSQPGVVHACQARVISDMQIAVENTMPVQEVSGYVSELVQVAPDVVEVCVKLSGELEFIPGQYMSVQFRGFPARCYSPTAALEWPCDPDAIRFQVRQFPDGRVSSALGRRILKGHKVTL